MKIGKLQHNLKDQLFRLVKTSCTLKCEVADKSNFNELEEWVTDIEEEVKNTLNERKVFMEVSV